MKLRKNLASPTRAISKFPKRYNALWSNETLANEVSEMLSYVVEYDFFRV